MENSTFAFIKTDKKLVKLFFKDISIIRGLGNYVEVYIENRHIERTMEFVISDKSIYTNVIIVPEYIC
ncbi:hypothetical protein [Chryseobacterium bernardetii]|uniref:hypothetical protein n=1 Tax=Chryseobacterium bernardetii TaxID=1241978 RepID=UPI00301ACA8B